MHPIFITYLLIFIACFIIGLTCWVSDYNDQNPYYKTVSARIILLSFVWPLVFVVLFFWAFYRISKDAFTKLE